MTNVSSTSSSGWTQLRQQTRSLEVQTETLLHSYSQYASMASNLSLEPSAKELQLKGQIEEVIKHRESLIHSLSKLCSSDSAIATTSALKQNNVSRHKQLLQESISEFNRIRQTINAHRNKMHLMSSHRDSEFTSSSSNYAQAEADYLLNERDRIDSTHSLIDGVLSQAYAINDNLSLNRETLASINRKLVGTIRQLPGVNNFISKIGTKKRRDTVILACFITFCIVLLMYMR